MDLTFEVTSKIKELGAKKCTMVTIFSICNFFWDTLYFVFSLCTFTCSTTAYICHNRRWYIFKLWYYWRLLVNLSYFVVSLRTFG